MQGDEQYPCPDIIACILLRGVRCLWLVACCFVAAIIVRLCDLPVFHVCWPCASLVPVTLPEVNRVPGFLHAICRMLHAAGEIQHGKPMQTRTGRKNWEKNPDYNSHSGSNSKSCLIPTWYSQEFCHWAPLCAIQLSLRRTFVHLRNCQVALHPGIGQA